MTDIIEASANTHSEGGDMNARRKSDLDSNLFDRNGKYRPKGGELYFHSHLSEPVDGLERDGLDDAADAVSEAIVDELEILRSAQSKKKVGSTVLGLLNSAAGRTIIRDRVLAAAPLDKEDRIVYEVKDDGSVVRVGPRGTEQVVVAAPRA